MLGTQCVHQQSQEGKSAFSEGQMELHDLSTPGDMPCITELVSAPHMLGHVVMWRFLQPLGGQPWSSQEK